LRKTILHYISNKLPSSDISDINDIFKQLDTNNDGEINKEELYNGMNLITKKLNFELDEGYIEDFIKAADINHSGKIE